MKHILAAAVAVAALGLLVSCGSDNFGLTEEERSKFEASWRKRSSIEWEEQCEFFNSPQFQVNLRESYEGSLRHAAGDETAEERQAKAGARRAKAGAMVEYLMATKC